MSKFFVSQWLHEWLHRKTQEAFVLSSFDVPFDVLMSQCIPVTEEMMAEWDRLTEGVEIDD